MRDALFEAGGRKAIASKSSHSPDRSTGDVRIVVIGTGNPYRIDDAVGVVFARRLRRAAPPCATILEQDGDPAALIDAWARADAAFVVDAVHVEGPLGAAGRIYRFDAAQAPLPTRFFRYSTHAFGVAEAVELARSLGGMPPSLVVYGVRGEDFGHGEELSAEVDAACDEVVSRVLHEIGLLLGGASDG